MRKIRIFDNSFMGYSKSASLREENKDVTPTYFEWTDEGPLTKPTFFTDGAIKDAPKYGSAPGKIAWLLEPRCLRPENYEAAKENQRFFDVILTYDKEFMDGIPNARFYPFGGSSIGFDKWGIYPKSKSICMFVSDKSTTEGHLLRQKIADRFSNIIDIFGAYGGLVVESKFDVLKDYCFEVVVESCDIENYFTEKLLDPISVGTIPIYCGSSLVYTRFGGLTRPMPQFKNTEVLEFHLSQMEEAGMKNYYESFSSFLLVWNEDAQHNSIVEDYLFKFYPELFA